MIKLTKPQQEKLSRLLLGQNVMPHQLAISLGLKLQDAYDLLQCLFDTFPEALEKKKLVYHCCSESPVSAIPFHTDIASFTYCPQCEEEVNPEDVKTGLMYIIHSLISVDELRDRTTT